MPTPLHCLAISASNESTCCFHLFRGNVTSRLFFFWGSDRTFCVLLTHKTFCSIDTGAVFLFYILLYFQSRFPWIPVPKKNKKKQPSNNWNTNRELYNTWPFYGQKIGRFLVLSYSLFKNLTNLGNISIHASTVPVLLMDKCHLPKLVCVAFIIYTYFYLVKISDIYIFWNFFYNLAYVFVQRSLQEISNLEEFQLRSCGFWQNREMVFL